MRLPGVPAFANSWQVSSLNETVMNQILQLKPGQLVRFNQRQLLRVYPSNYRVDSSNFNPQPYWNTGCHMGERARGDSARSCSSFVDACSFLFPVALNYQTEGRMLELNRAKFSANGNCGYILKPKCMRKGKHASVRASGSSSFPSFTQALWCAQVPLTPRWTIPSPDAERLSWC